MRHCDGRLFDGSACNNDVLECGACGASGCVGDGCDNQSFTSTSCCGADLGVRELATAASCVRQLARTASAEPDMRAGGVRFPDAVRVPWPARGRMTP